MSVNKGAVETIADAVAFSTQHTELVTLLVGADDYEAIRALLVAEADDYVDVEPTEVDAWGTDAAGVEWRVQAKVEGRV